MTNDVGTFIGDTTTDRVELSGNFPVDERPATDVPADDTRSLVRVLIGELELVKVALIDESGLAINVAMNGKSGLLTIDSDFGRADKV